MRQPLFECFTVLTQAAHSGRSPCREYVSVDRDACDVIGIDKAVEQNYEAGVSSADVAYAASVLIENKIFGSVVVSDLQ